MVRSKAAVLHEMGMPRPYGTTKPLHIEEVEIDDPGFEEVLVKIKAAGLCHSDLSVINGNRPRPLPMVLGHEAAGEVVKLGAGVDRLEVGDHVVFAFLPSCGHCSYCKVGKAALCEPGAVANTKGVLLSGHRRIRKQDRYYNHHMGVSVFSDYSVASIHSLVKIDTSIPFDIAALFGCAVMTGVGAAVNTAQVRLGDSVLVVGLGGVGLSAILGARAAGARKVIGADINQKKREMALQIGADSVIDSSSPGAMAELKESTNGGVDVSLEFAGVIPALEFAFRATKRGGTTVTAALPHPDARLHLSPVELVGQEKNIKGSYLGSCVPDRDIPHYLELFKAGRLPVEQLISHKISLEEVNKGFERLANGKAVRQIILFD
ncbi:zinc-dependent alcohol dehydrogenase family protein [Membranicola marinus]|uniref:Zinc-dependent alcohol dehydrogenase family protein n=1 Tax=Membranihabitans marinus TaxID=1227546 RepID=A0A953HRZ4_9BACT|nr:zinc-dependent alcohol dehydrogenase family protein [Membranihabitans marinus]MBY5957186.1 zinc-dependent alcohol dehydrogenase family protein [Membranihabitans marinus]